MADSNQIIGATIKVDTGTSGQNVKGLKKDVTELKGALNETTSAAGGTSKAISESGGSFGKLREQMKSIPGATGAAGEGLNKLSLAFKALMANPIVALIAAIVAGLTLLYKAFTNTFAGAEKVEQVFAGIKAAAQALFDNLEHVAKAIIKFFSFDFSGALDEINTVVDAVGNAYTAMAKLTEEAQQLHREQIQNDIEQAERAKKLAVLREQATDETVPIAKRKALLKELRDETEKNAKEDVDLAQRTAKNKIAQLTLEKDGELKNMDEIAKARIEAIQVETENANELRRVNKQLLLADRQEKAEAAAAAKAAAEAAKAERQKLVEFTNKLLKLQQENELALIKDGYQKELKQLENKIAEDKRANDLAYKDKKITLEQRQQLDAAQDIKYNLDKSNIDDKHNKEVAKKEADFQKELSSITSKTRVDGIKDVRKAELVQLEIGYNEKLAQAIERYKDDQQKFQAIKNALDEQLKAEQEKLQEKFRKEDLKKRFEIEEGEQKIIRERKNFDFDAKLKAADAEQQLVQQAFDNKVITEADYNTKVEALTNARKAIRDQERAHNQAVTSDIANAFGALADIAGRQTVVGKALSIAQTTIATYQSAISAYRGVVAEIPGPAGIVLGGIAAAGAIAQGVAAVKKIIAVQIPGQGAAGGTAPTGLPIPAAPIAPTQGATTLDANSLNNIGNAATASRAYVLDADVNHHQEINARLNRAARLGG